MTAALPPDTAAAEPQAQTGRYIENGRHSFGIAGWKTTNHQAKEISDKGYQ